MLAPKQLSQDVIQRLKKIVGTAYVLSSAVDLAAYECDAETLDIARPDVVVLPSTTEEVAAVVQLANSLAIPFVVRGAGTGLSGGATCIMGGINIVLTRMTKILDIDSENMVAVVEVGVTNSAVSEAAEEFGLYFAPDPSSQTASTIGGNIAENAGGPHTLKYGMTTNHVLGITMVSAEGKIMTLGGKSKARVGLDLIGLLVGSEGTLGIVTEAVLNLMPRSQAVETMLAYFSTVEDAGNAVSTIIARGVIPAAMEMMDGLTLNAVEDAQNMGLMREAAALLIVELDGPRTGIFVQRQIVESCLQPNNVKSFRWANDATERAKIWKARKSAFGGYGRIAPHAYVLDGVIPRSKLAEAITKIAAIGEKHVLIIGNVYHAGDGNLHPCLLFHRDNLDEVKRVMIAASEILEMCVDLGGTLSGEHGVGIEKVAEMAKLFTSEDLEAMRWIKSAFNSSGHLNPGKLLPTVKSCGESGMRPLLRFQIIGAC